MSLEQAQARVRTSKAAYVAVPLLLALVALRLPARRDSRVDPIDLLRYELKIEPSYPVAALRDGRCSGPARLPLPTVSTYGWILPLDRSRRVVWHELTGKSRGGGLGCGLLAGFGCSWHWSVRTCGRRPRSMS